MQSVRLVRGMPPAQRMPAFLHRSKGSRGGYRMEGPGMKAERTAQGRKSRSKKLSLPDAACEDAAVDSHVSKALKLALHVTRANPSSAGDIACFKKY